MAGGGQSFLYEALWDGAGTDGRPHVVGMVDVATLAEAPSFAATTADYEGQNSQFELPTSPHRWGFAVARERPTTCADAPGGPRRPSP